MQDLHLLQKLGRPHLGFQVNCDTEAHFLRIIHQRIRWTISHARQAEISKNKPTKTSKENNKKNKARHQGKSNYIFWHALVLPSFVH